MRENANDLVFVLTFWSYEMDNLAFAKPVSSLIMFICGCVGVWGCGVAGKVIGKFVCRCV